MEELEKIVRRMREAGESQERIKSVIQSYNASKSSTPETPEVAEPLKKKETTESPSPSEEGGSVLDGSEADKEVIPVTPIQDVPVQEFNEPVAELYKLYKKTGKITNDQIASIDEKLKNQSEGERGWWETTKAVIDGFVHNGVGVPIFQFDNKEDLVAAQEQKNKVDFLSELPEETVAELKTYAGEKISDLGDSNLNVLAENRLMEERGKQLVNELKYHADAIEKVKSLGREVPQEAIEQYKKMHGELTGIYASYNKNVDFLENNNEDIGDFYEEVNLLKKNYGGLDYYKDMARLTSASMMAGVGEMALSTRDIITDKTGIKPLIDAPFTQEDVAGFREEIANQQEYQAPAMSVTDIEGGADFMAWLGEQVATQLPVLTVLAASGGTAGLGVLGVSAAGQKIGELEDARTEAKKTIEHLNNVLNTSELSIEEVTEIEKELEKAKRTSDVSDDEMYMAGLGTGTLEVLTERVSLGILSKGKRAFLAAKKGGMLKEFGKGLGRGSVAGMQEGSAEFVNAFGTNLIDIMYLNDPDVHVFDGTIDALASGFAMGVGMRVAPVAVGMGHKAFAPKEVTKELKDKTQKISDILGEVENQGDKMDKDTKKMMVSKANKLKREVAKTMKGTFENVANMPKEDITELIKLEKAANKVMVRIDNLKKQPIDPAMKEEFLLDLKAEVDGIIARKQELIDKKNGPKQETTTIEGEVKDGTEGQDVQGQTVEDTGNVTDVESPALKLKRESAGVYKDVINDYSVKKEGKEWVVKTKPFEKNGKKMDEGTELFRGRTLKEAAAYLDTQTKKREAIFNEQVESDNVFEATEDGKSKFNWRKLLTGVPFVSYLDEMTFSKVGTALENKYADLTADALQGELNFDADSGNLVARGAKAVANVAINRIARLNNALYSGAARTDVAVAAKRRVQGLQEMSLVKGRLLTKELSDLIDGDPESAKRVHQALDPELYDETVGYDDLTQAEKNLHDTLRAINQQTHEMNYKNGFISKETFDKYDGKYIGRGYEVYEGLEEEIDRELLLDNKIFGKIYKKRQEINQWIIDNTVNDPIYLTMNRAIRSERNAVVKQYAEFIEGKYARKEKPENGTRWVQLAGKSYGSLAGKWIPSNIAEDFKGYFFENGFLDALHKVSDVYNQTAYKQFMKRYHTVYSPLVQAGNFLSNHAFAFAAGVNLPQLYRELPEAYKELREKTGDYQMALQEGLIGSNVLDKDLQLSSDLSKQLSLRGKASIKKLDDKARALYSGSDNIMKLAAYKSLKRAGYTHAEATERVYQGFQNYASVGKLWDLASKLPVWGADYVKFQGDLNRIVKNAVLKRPLTTVTFLYSLQGLASLLSRASGEEEEEQAIREGRKFIPKIQTFVGDFPLVFKVGDKEVNLARYISPFYKYDRDNAHWIERLSEFAPIKIGADEDTGELRVVPSDVALGSIWAAFVDNKDFRDKLISDPTYNIYTGSTATNMEKLTNRVLYVLRSQVPLFAFGHDTYLSQAFGEDYYGRDKSPLDVALSRIVKIQTWDKSTTTKQVVKEIKGINYQVKKLKTKSSALKNGYNKEVNALNKRHNEGLITAEALERKREVIKETYESRLANLALDKAKVQEKFNTLSTNAKEAGLNFNALFMKTKK